MRKKIVILTASSGGGHDSAADALEQMLLKQLRGNCNVQKIDIYQQSVFSQLPSLARIRYYSDTIWQLFFSLTNSQFTSELITWLMKPWMVRSLKKQLPNECDYLIAVHFNPAQCLSDLAESYARPPKSAILVTDFDPHWAWLGKGCDRILLLSEEGKEKAKQQGYENEQILPLNLIPTVLNSAPKPPKPPKPDTKLYIGMVCGQDGSNRKQIYKLLQALNTQAVASHLKITVICGKNRRLYQYLQRVMPTLGQLEINLCGYFRNLKDHLGQFDLMAIRTSPAILSECIIAGVPVLGFQWSSHEVYQRDFINQHNLGLASQSCVAICEFVDSLVAQPQTLKQLKSNLAKIAAQQNEAAICSHILMSDAAEPKAQLDVA